MDGSGFSRVNSYEGRGRNVYPGATYGPQINERYKGLAESIELHY